MTRIVIVGGGYAGFYTAFKLQKLLRRGEAEVVVIDPLPYMTYQPFLPEVAAGSIEARHAIVPLRRHLNKCRVITARVTGINHSAKTVTVTKNEILTALNKPEDFILAIVLVPPPEDGKAVDPWQIQDSERPYGIAPNGCRVHYVRNPFSREPDFNATSVNYKLDQLLANAEVPS